MERKKIIPENFNANIFSLYSREWMLLTAGDFASGKFNTMTISWGMLGYFWNRDVVMVGARPQRYTLEFLDRYDSFTLSVLPENFREDLNLLGSVSGRNENKLAKTSLDPIASDTVDAPGFAQAELIIECKKIYSDKLNGKNFIDKSLISGCYPNRDFHHLIIGEISNISGQERFIRK